MGRRVAVAGLMVARLVAGTARLTDAEEASPPPSVVRQSLEDA
jgi:hypothetical protein